MPKIKNLDDFIELSTDLLQHFPSTTTLSITYSNTSKKPKNQKPSKKPTTQTNKATNEVNIKLYEPHQGKLLKFKTKKQKELSKILNILGPQGLSNQLGLTSLMTNVKYIEPEVSVVDDSIISEDVKNSSVITSKEGTPLVEENKTTASSSKKKNKKKKKKN
ncbi:hypothetical protein KGF54_001155 [Candida jiufengensis]|uniref:uncharacterized protein n=1 Tax=Candida jiufengensis TaxID=497108 RepID=UPI0022244F63|nr:uncharacterized protein KGF54_001155 [Candida jiufengensis]KAI5955653.1 hypothetical protein KGF54_001155 [Candida jiufengensis]